MNRLWLPVWFSARCIYALLALAALLALGVWTPLAWYAGCLGAVLVIASLCTDAVLGPRSAELSIEREGDRAFVLRIPSALHYRVTNRSKVGVRCGIIETPVDLLQFDDRDIVTVVTPRSLVRLERSVLPCARGTEALTVLYAWVENGIGLLRRRIRVAAQAEIRVYPDLSAVQRYGSLRAHNRLIESGLRRMRLRGTGTQFESLREWSYGDAYRWIDWKATAKRGKLMVAQHEVERSQNVMLLLDCGRLMTARIKERSKFDYVVTAALSVATIAGLANDKVGFLAFAEDVIDALTPRASKKAVPEITGRIYGLQPRFQEADYGRAFNYMRAHLAKRTLIIFFTDMFDPVASATVLEQMGNLGTRHLIVCVFMNDAAIQQALSSPVESVRDAYRASVAMTLLEERRKAAVLLAARGVHVIDAPAANLSVSLINAYLDIKRRGLL